MFRQISTYVLLLSLLFSSVTFAGQAKLPQHIVANYLVTRDGMPFAKVQEQFEVTGHTYKIESTTKGIGVYALLGVRQLISTGNVTSDGLVPLRFELQQGGNPKKALFADFDWSKKILRMLVKGNPQEVNLSAGTLDLASFAYQFMFYPKPLSSRLKNDPANNLIDVTLTTGKKIKQYQYKIIPEFETLEAAGTQYKTVHLAQVNQDPAQVETKELWLAAEKNNLLVRLLLVDEDGAKLEQTLTELHVD